MPKREILGCSKEFDCEKSKYIDAIHELGNALKKLKIPFEYYYPAGKFGDIFLPWCKGMIHCNMTTWGNGSNPFKLEGRQFTELNESINWFTDRDCTIKTVAEAYKRTRDEWNNTKKFIHGLLKFAESSKTFSKLRGSYSLGDAIAAYNKERRDKNIKDYEKRLNKRSK